MTARLILAASAILAAGPIAARADVVVDFEDLALPPNSFHNGMPDAPVVGVTYDGSFTSGGATFNNTWRRSQFGSFTFDSWSGWSYSNLGSTITDPGGLTEYSRFQYHSATGGGFGGSGNFGVAFGSSAIIDLPSLAAGAAAMSVRITNTTYAVMSMLNGDQFAKKFGGASGNDPDFFELTIIGFDGLGATGSIIGEVPFLLADYRFADNSLDYVVRDWRLVDLTSLLGSRSLGFRLRSSDEGVFGMNTPAYFALDELTIVPFSAVPEPASILALAVGLAGVWVAASRRCHDL
ncbi:DUF4465 domain-containing protein [Tautonia sociabilis]|uniref:DUF4465 domain-containing protein n=1 Tax=Tautonia sociabilis TaxID=2080755 RepID=A0A432MIV9_9BACT|nr:DUF4465 domain-containing protein [Tautonia sociabilis]RUL87304.1 DUF4465 domain-containing protein [Tautonia sociabilis]